MDAFFIKCKVENIVERPVDSRKKKLVASGPILAA